MKKGLLITAAVLVLVLALGVFAYAEDDSSNVPEWYTEMIQWKKAQIEKALNDGLITEEQAQIYLDRIDSMVKYHEENGYPNEMGYGGCAGGVNGKGGKGFGPGMMNGNFNSGSMMNNYRF